MKTLFVLLFLGLLQHGVVFGANGSGNVTSVKTMGGVDSVNGGINMPNTDTTYFTLWGSVNSSATGNYYVFYKNGTQYQVTTGKTCRCEDWGFLSAATNNLQLQLVSSLTSWAQNAASLTSGTYQGGAAGVYPINTGPTANVWRIMHFPYEFVALSYPGFGTGNSTQNYAVFGICREI